MTKFCAVLTVVLVLACQVLASSADLNMHAIKLRFSPGFYLDKGGFGVDLGYRIGDEVDVAYGQLGYGVTDKVRAYGTVGHYEPDMGDDAMTMSLGISYNLADTSLGKLYVDSQVGTALIDYGSTYTAGLDLGLSRDFPPCCPWFRCLDRTSLYGFGGCQYQTIDYDWGGDDSEFQPVVGAGVSLKSANIFQMYGETIYTDAVAWQFGVRLKF